MSEIEAKLSQNLTTSRIQNLVDGVFATAMTLMLFNLHVPANFPAENLSQIFVALAPELLTFFLSMFVLGSFWVGHHNQSHWIKHSNRTYLWINIFFLSFVVLIPFTTALLSYYYSDSIAVALYGMNLLICGFILFLHWDYATQNHRLVDPDLSPEIISTMRFRVLAPFVLGIAVIAFAFYSPVGALFLYVILFIPGAIPTVSDKIIETARSLLRK